MDFSKLSVKKIRELIIFTALLAAALWKFAENNMGNHIPLCTGRRNCFCHQRADELSGKDDLWENQRRKEKK